MRAVVLGGGIAGLSAGLELRRQGVSTTILEGERFPGGLASGFRDRGYTFDLFSHRLWTRDVEVLRSVEDWLGEPLLVRRKISRILLDGRLYNYPIDLRDLLAGGSTRMALRAVAGYASARLSSPRRGDDFRSFLVSRYGEPLFDTFFGPYTEKLCGCPPEELSVDLALGAVPSAGLLRQLVHRLIGRVDPWDDFYYPRGGFMEVPDGMARAFEKTGGDLRQGSKVERLECRGGRIVSVAAMSPEGRLDLPADLVVSTIPLPALLRSLAEPPGEVLEAAAGLHTRALVCVYLGIRREKISDDHWIYIPDPTIRFNRISETTNYSEGMAPPGRTGLCIEVACDFGDPAWREGDEAQVRRVVDDLIRIGLLRSHAEVEASWVRRFSRAYPVYRVGYRERLQRVEAHLRRVPNLAICGRQGAFWYGSTADGIRQGFDLIRDLGLSGALAA